MSDTPHSTPQQSPAAEQPVRADARKTAKKTAQKTAKKAAGQGFSKEERAAMKERAAELKAAAKGAAAEADVLAKIAAMPDADRVVAEHLHALVGRVAPQLGCKTFYGFPAYTRDDRIVFFYQPAAKFGIRYGRLDFTDATALDDGAMWPCVYAIDAWTEHVEREVTALVARALA